MTYVLKEIHMPDGYYTYHGDYFVRYIIVYHYVVQLELI